MTQQLSPEDKTFIKLHTDGKKNSAAFKEAYPDHPAVVGWMQSKKGSIGRQKFAENIKDLAKQKLKTKYIANALSTYQDRMEQFSSLSLDTAIDLVKNARSEKVRADLAIEGIRQKVGNPTQKIQSTEEQTVIIQFGRPPESKPIDLSPDEFSSVDAQDDTADRLDSDTE